MKEFKNDLISLFKKHGILVIKDSVEINVSPLIIEGRSCYADFTFKFSKVIVDKNERKEHLDNYGLKFGGFL